MTFNINQQNAGVINNVAGDQTISGGQQGTVITLDQARDAVRELRQAVVAAPLDPSTAAEARARADDLDAELRKDAPDPPTVAGRLRTLTDLLKSAGSLAAAGTGIVGPLQTLLTWLSQHGELIAHLRPPF